MCKGLAYTSKKKIAEYLVYSVHDDNHRVHFQTSI